MHRFLVHTLLFLAIGIPSLAQPGKAYQLNGIVQNDQGEPIPYASISLYLKKDSSLLKGTTSNETGYFQLKSKPGNYILNISFLSYEVHSIPNLSISNESIHLGKITLQNSSLDLDEVTIAAEKRQMELKLDKRVFNVGKDLSNVGNNAAEVLDNIPSVEVDVDGNVSLRGSENVRILIDGKPSGLVGMSSADALRQLQGSMIEKIEVITNPSARYDAEGEVGIINVVMKKGKQKGINGSFDLHGGYPDNYGAGYQLNFRRKKINFFSGIGINYRETPGNGSTQQEFFNADSATILNSERKHTRGGLSNNFKLGMDYSINQYNSVTLSSLYQTAENDNEVRMQYNYENDTGELLEVIERKESEREKKEVIEGNLSYKRTFKKKGREWTSDVKWILNDDIENADLYEESNLDIKKPLVQRTSNTENENNWLIQSDYIHPFAKDGQFEMGVKTSLRNIENDYLLEQRASDGIFNAVSAFDNYFIYLENIYAAYLMVGNTYKQLSYQFGMRWEYSDITTELRETKEKNKNNYHNLFPSAHFTYEMKKENSLQLSYSRRISRPRFRHLLPFYGYSDSRNFYSGNPLLQPEFSNSLEMGHLKYWKKGSLLSSIYYRYRTGVVERVSISDSAGSTRRFPINLSTQNAFGLEFNASYSFFKWWRMNSSFNFYRAITEGKYQGQNLDSDAYSWSNRSSTKFDLWDHTNLQVSFNYRAPIVTTQGRRLSRHSLDISISREVLKKRGTLSCSVKDIFNTRKWRNITDTEDFYTQSEFQWRSRQFLINFNYRLNQQKKRGGNKQPSNQSFGGGDEM